MIWANESGKNFGVSSMKNKKQYHGEFSSGARKFNQANGHFSSKKEVQDEINNTIKKEKIHSCMTKKEQEEYWNTFTDLEKDVIGFIDRVIIDRDSTEYTSS